MGAFFFFFMGFVVKDLENIQEFQGSEFIAIQPCFNASEGSSIYIKIGSV